MVDIRINYETLFDLLRREKNREELSALDKDFYEQVLAYLKEKRDSLSKKDDELFASAEKEKLKIQFQNIRRLIKELYERREKRIINMAMNKARTGSDVIDTSSLLPSEREFFDDQVMLFIQYKDKVLDRILNLKEFESSKVETMAARAPVRESDEASTETEPAQKPTLAVEEEKESSKNENDAQVPLAAAISSKKRVIIRDSMPKFMGRSGDILGPFNEGDEVEIDAVIADILVKRGKAELSQ